jgi:hypothetical protein
MKSGEIAVLNSALYSGYWQCRIQPSIERRI